MDPIPELWEQSNPFLSKWLFGQGTLSQQQNERKDRNKEATIPVHKNMPTGGPWALITDAGEQHKKKKRQVGT